MRNNDRSRRRFATLPTLPPGSRFAAYFAEKRAAAEKAIAKGEARRAGNPAAASIATVVKHGRARSGIPTAKAPSRAEIVAAARREARARYENVMSSDVAKGRERQAEALLLASCDRNAKFKNSMAIIAELRGRCTDAELDARRAAYEARLAASERAEIAASWDRAYAAVFGMEG